MAKIPLPERGQPLDLSYIYQIANAVNDLSNQVSPSSSKYMTVDTTTGKQTLRTSDAKVVGGYVTVTNNSIVSAGNERAFEYPFPSNFRYPPIVTATIVNVGDTPAGKTVTVTLTDVNYEKVKGVVKFGAAGDVSVAVNLIAIGVPE
tara:strand:+ start:11366 stop:11806 length:441 start_codon:yes stop_codon:yes gene_type:complete